MSGSFGGQQALFLDETVEVGARHGPGVALVLDKAVHDRDRATPPVLLKLVTSKQRRRMRERNGFRQKTTDFDFWVDAALNSTEELDDAVGSHQDGRVGLLGIHGSNVVDGERATVRKSRRWRKLDAALVGFDHPRGTQVFQKQGNKA